jgi:hypothetical protein
VRFLYRGLDTATPSQHANQGWDPYQRVAGHVLVLQQDASRSIRTKRGTKGSTADLEGIFRRRQLRVSTLPNPTRSTLEDYASSETPRTDPPDVVHICATADTAAHKPALDLAGSGDPADAVGAADLEVLAWAFSADRFPLFVFDTPGSTSSLETVRHLLLRNYLAGQLLALGHVPVVLATGLALGHRRARQLDVLAQALAAGKPPAVIWQRLTQAADAGTLDDLDGLEEAVAFLATALFSQLPPAAEPP